MHKSDNNGVCWLKLYNVPSYCTSRCNVFSKLSSGSTILGLADFTIGCKIMIFVWVLVLGKNYGIHWSVTVIISPLSMNWWENLVADGVISP
jgi:hypothetical protein